MRGRTLTISAYLFLAALAAPAMVGAQAPAPTANATTPGQPTTSTADPPQGGNQLLPQGEPSPGSGAPAQSSTYDRKPDRKGGKGNPSANAAASFPVRIVDFKFKPKTINIEVGDTITWTNEDSEPHNAVANNGAFDTHTLKEGQSGSHKFTEDATIKYTCTIHANMKGTVVVGNGGNGGGGGGGGGSGGTSSGSGSGSDPFIGGSSSSATGTSSSLPSTGQNELPLVVAGGVLLTLGLLLRRFVWSRI